MATRDPEQTRQMILAAAFEEIHEHGFQAASLDRILGKTNVTKGALYHHFPNKHALGLAVVDEIIGKDVDEWRISALKQHDDPFDAILLAAQAEVTSLTEQEMQRGCPLNNLIQEMSPLDADFRDHLQAIVRRWHKALTGVFQAGQRKRKVRSDVDCNAAAWFILSSYIGCIGLCKVLEKQEVLASIFSQATQYFNGLRA